MKSLGFLILISAVSVRAANPETIGQGSTSNKAAQTSIWASAPRCSPEWKKFCGDLKARLPADLHEVIHDCDEPERQTVADAAYNVANLASHCAEGAGESLVLPFVFAFGYVPKYLTEGFEWLRCNDTDKMKLLLSIAFKFTDKPEIMDSFYIESDDIKTHFGQFNGQRQTYITETHHATPGLFGPDPFGLCLFVLDLQ